ncbi:hypothetical protein [Cognaticolwellia aestuarii]
MTEALTDLASSINNELGVIWKYRPKVFKIN